VLLVSGLPGVDKKVPDSAPDFVYTHDAHHAVTGACVEVETEEEMDDTFSKHPRAWVVNSHSYLICLHTSSPTVEDVKSQQSGLSLAGAGASGNVLADVHKSLSGLTTQKWSKMNHPKKQAIWRLVGLDAAGKNPAGCLKDSMLKEVQPMVGNCSYGDACLVTQPTARWPYVCAEVGCGKYVDLNCCEKFVQGLKEEVRKCTFVQDVVQPSSARANVVCQSCVKLAIKEYNRTIREESPRKHAERQPSTAKRARVDSHGSASGVFDMYSVNMQQLTPVHTWNVSLMCPALVKGKHVANSIRA